MTVKTANRSKIDMWYKLGTQIRADEGKGTVASSRMQIQLMSEDSQSKTPRPLFGVKTVKSANFMSHAWNTTISNYNGGNFLTQAEIGPTEYEITLRIWNAHKTNGKILATTGEVLKSTIQLIRQAANTDIAMKTPGELHYKAYDPAGNYTDCYAVGYITGLTIEEVDSASWWADVTMTFLSLSGTWYQDLAVSGTSTSGLNEEIIYSENFETNSDFIFSTTNWDGQGNVFAIGDRKETHSLAFSGWTGTNVYINTKDKVIKAGTGTNATNLIPYLSGVADPFRKLYTAGWNKVTMKTACTYEFHVLKETTLPTIRSNNR